MPEPFPGQSTETQYSYCRYRDRTPARKTDQVAMGLAKTEESASLRATSTGRDPCRVNTRNDRHISYITECALYAYLADRT